jgi:hypothetical protein
MDLTGHNKWTLFPILHRIIVKTRSRRKTSERQLAIPTSSFPNKQDQFFCADPFGLSDWGTIGIFNLRLRAMQLRICDRNHARSYGSRWQKGTVGLMEIGKPTTVDVKEPANEGQIGGQHYKRLAIHRGIMFWLTDIGYWRGRLSSTSLGGRIRTG